MHLIHDITDLKKRSIGLDLTALVPFVPGLLAFHSSFSFIPKVVALCHLTVIGQVQEHNNEVLRSVGGT